MGTVTKEICDTAFIVGVAAQAGRTRLTATSANSTRQIEKISLRGAWAESRISWHPVVRTP
ncbi:hypothetical protein Tasa_028_026 [Tanticharoenia sakaeratensis NBRC 103193]|uniref:Uncharacterized protein n=1 Tax=Tanticharoenia sakaeratensis NBRC 103193 TaxID=1231623 RepID=A0A0D6MLU5_9PROT|nr:hypothetical protein Tasa_028_026 [Tanticharoenia sakaeratensis NBRC 103193]GBQ16750.1 hypothetical protein AA103193_0090 [Tanticharoenia sakaeratensis NBRC 103193]